MARSNLCISRETKLAKKIIKGLPKQSIRAEVFGIKQSSESYREHNMYPELLETAIKLMDMAGFEVKEKE